MQVFRNGMHLTDAAMGKVSVSAQCLVCAAVVL
jgi:hypothetical protein